MITTTTRADGSALQAPATELARSQKGSVLIEFAFVLPVFLLILFGVIFFSVALYNKTVLTMATREGARTGVVYVAGTNANATRISNATTAATQLCQNNLISFGDAMTASIDSTIAGDMLTVSANGVYDAFFIFPALPISAQTRMRLE